MKKLNFITLKSKFGTSNSIFMLNMIKKKHIYLKFCQQQKKLGNIRRQIRFFSIWVPVQNEILGPCHRFQEIFTLSKQFCRNQKNVRSAPKSSDCPNGLMDDFRL